MRNWGSSTSSTAQDDGSANYALVFPPLSGDKPTKRQDREAKLASVPLDLSSYSEIVNQEDENLSSASHDLKSCSLSTAETETEEEKLAGLQTGDKDWSPADDAKTCPQLAEQQGRVLSQRKKRLGCFTELDVGEKLPKPETTTVAKKPEFSSGKGTMSAEVVESTSANPAGSSTTPPLSETLASSCETVPLALFPYLTGEIQSKKQKRNAHLLPPKQHE